MFNPTDLSVLCYANGFTLWHYKTTDKQTTALEGNYFNQSSGNLKVNDLIIMNSDIDEKPHTEFLIVTGNDGNTVTVEQYR